MTFIPTPFAAQFIGNSLLSIKPDLDREVTGTVVYINRAHRWCRVRYQSPGVRECGYECFKF